MFFKWIPIGLLILFLLYCGIPTVWLWGKCLFRFNKLLTKEQILLSFDDGPDHRYTGKLLDVLAENQIKAAFFVVADKVPDHIELIRRIQSEGHTLALHSWSHRNACLMGYRHTKKNFEQSMEMLDRYGIKVNFLRPPWGMVNLFGISYLRKYRLDVVFWHVMARDWSQHSTVERIIHKLRKRSKDRGVIVCLHDSGEQSGGAPGAPLRTIEALNRLLPVWLAEGRQFVNLKDISVKSVNN